MVFPHNFNAQYLGKATGGILDTAVSGGTYALDAGEVGIFPIAYDGVQSNALSAVPGTPLQQVVIGVGTWRTTDNINEFQTGYAQNSWTLPMPLKNVRRFERNVASAPVNQIVAFGWDMSVTGSTADIGPTFLCGTNYELKLEVLGEPALKTFNKFMFNNFPAWGGCCGTECASGCTSTYADAACIMLQWKDALYTTPNWVDIPGQWGGFVLPQVFINDAGVKTEVFSQLDYDQGRITDTNDIYVCDTTTPEAVIAGLQITVAYTDSTFSNCTFSLTDSYDYYPAYVLGSLVNQYADPCIVNTTINSSVPNMFKEIQAPKQPIGLGWNVRHGLVMQDRIEGNPWADTSDVLSLRMREIEGSNWITDNVTNGSLYDKVIIEWFLPNETNGSSNYDGSLTSLVLHVPTGTTTTGFTNLFQGLLDDYGSGVQLITT